MGDTLGKINSVAWNPDGKRIASASEDKSIRIWDAGTGREFQKIKLPENKSDAESLIWTPEGKYLLFCCDSTIQIWDTDNAMYFKHGVWPLEGRENERVHSLALSPGGLIASGSSGGSIKIWSGSGLRYSVYQEFTPHRHSGITALAFSPDGKLLAYGTGGNSISIWNIKKEGKKKLSADHPSRSCIIGPGPDPVSVTSLAFSPDGKLLLSGHDSDEHTITIYDIKSAKKLCTLSGGKNISSFRKRPPVIYGRFCRNLNKTIVGWSPDGKKFLSAGSDTIKIWDAEKKWELRTFSRHTGPIESAVWSPDGKFILSGAKDETIRIYDADKGQILEIR
jgi:WD40 repeat protein